MLPPQPSSSQNMEWGEEGRGEVLREKLAGGSRGGGQKPSAQTEPTVFKFNQLYARPLSILPFFPSLFHSISVSLSSSLCLSLSLFLCLPNNGLFVMQEANSTSIIRPSFHPHHHHHHHHHLVLYCNKYANEQKPVIGNFKLDSLVLKKDTNVLIASGQRNPIFFGHWLQNWCERLFFKSQLAIWCECVCVYVHMCWSGRCRMTEIWLVLSHAPNPNVYHE